MGTSFSVKIEQSVLDEGELLRYLAETPLYPTALLPETGGTWTPIDDQSARVTLENRGTTASLVFYVNDRNEVERVTGEWAFLKDDGTSEYRPWRGYRKNYEERAGMRIPTDGEVTWVHSEGMDGSSVGVVRRTSFSAKKARVPPSTVPRTTPSVGVFPTLRSGKPSFCCRGEPGGHPASRKLSCDAHFQ